jgi:hypothetical protein
MSDEEREGIRGDELADEAGGTGSEAPETADGGVRGGEGLAEDGVRGDGLADDAA